MPCGRTPRACLRSSSRQLGASGRFSSDLRNSQDSHADADCVGLHSELAYQISDQFTALGSGIGVRVATIVGGMDTMAQQVALAKKPHIVVATPGRLQDHLENTKGFSLRNLKYLVSARFLHCCFGAYPAWAPGLHR